MINDIIGTYVLALLIVFAIAFAAFAVYTLMCVPKQFGAIVLVLIVAYLLRRSNDKTL